jgi:isoquinoline 1-oxidoreductase beta subunit
MKTKAHTIDRREFIKLSAVSGAFLAVGCLPSPGKETKIVNLADASGLGKEINQYIFINDAGKITLFNHRPEMGQGTFQSIPMIIAEELEVDISAVEIKQSPANRELYGDQMVVGSRSMRGNFDLMRKMGAAAKEMLIKAAANKWKVSESDCYAENAFVINKSSGEKFSYAELVEDASKLSAPGSPKLKSTSEFKVLGQNYPRRDIPSKTNGTAKFGMDMTTPGMLYATIERSPLFLAKIVRFNADNALKVPGVKHVFKTSREVWGNEREGVAVLAENYWAAVQGRRVLEIEWDNKEFEKNTSESLLKESKEASEQPGNVFESSGDFEKAFNDAVTKVESAYETPYQSHAPMEPMNAIVSVTDNKVEFWGSTQNPNGIKSFLSRKTGVPESKVIINYTFMGGGFGRRSMTDVAEEAADLSMKSKAPVKVIWTREDDITQGPFRAASYNVAKGGLDKDGNLVALEHKVICQDIRNQTGGNNTASGSIAGGIVTDYAIPNFRINGVLRKFYIPISYWRAVYHSTNTFAHECFMDELARAGKKDPLAFRLDLLKNHRRFSKVLQEVAGKSGWNTPKDTNTGRGLAIVERSGAFVAMVAEVHQTNNKIAIRKFTTAIDCGIPVHPDTIIGQTEGCIIMGLTATFNGLTVVNGAIAEGNFDTYKMLQLRDSPEMEVSVIDSTDAPEGAGEAALPTVAPALVNAIFDLTGKRIRKLPFKLEEV